MLNIRLCHYYNNMKVCPFEEIGCMFRHAKSNKCWVKEFCKNKLCQYAHDIHESTTNDTTENVPQTEAAQSNDAKSTTETIDIERDV